MRGSAWGPARPDKRTGAVAVGSSQTYLCKGRHCRSEACWLGRLNHHARINLGASEARRRNARRRARGGALRRRKQSANDETTAANPRTKMLDFRGLDSSRRRGGGTLGTLGSILCYIMLYHVISYHIISYHIISYHIISYHIIYIYIYIYITLPGPQGVLPRRGLGVSRPRGAR